MIAIVLPITSSYCVRYMDVGEGREQDAEALKILLIAAIFALYLILLNSKLINQTYSEVP